MSDQLDQLVNEIHEDNLKQRALQKLADEGRERDEQHAALAEIDGWLHEDLNDVYGMLESRLEFSAKRDQYGGFKVIVKFRDGLARWNLTSYSPMRRSAKWYIEAYFTRSGYPDINLSCERTKLRLTLLEAMGDVRAKQEAAATEAQRSAFRELATACQHAWNSAARQLEAERQRIEAYRVDAEITEMINERIDAARADLWKWRNSTPVTFYRMRWLTGVGATFDDVRFDYDTGYTITDELDERGYITVFERYNTHRAVKLDMEAHKLMWERLTASSIDDLPGDLKQKQELRIDGIGYENGLLVYREFDSVTATVGVIPVEWVQRVVTATIAGLHGYLTDDYYTEPSKPIRVFDLTSPEIAAKIAVWHALFGAQDASTGAIDWVDPDYALSEGMIDADDVELYRAYIAAHQPRD